MALTLVAALVFLAAMLIIVLFASQIFLYFYLARTDDPNTGLNYGMSALITDAAIALSIVAENLSDVGTSASSAVPGVVGGTSSVVVLTIVAVLYSSYQSSVFQVVDSKLTTLWFPFYHNVILPILNAVTIAWESVACWYNIVASAERVVTYETFHVLEECVELEWKPIIDAILQTLLAFGNALMDYIASGFSAEFDLKSIADGLGLVIYNSVQIFNCLCADLFFAFDWVGNVCIDPALHWAIFHLGNAPLDVVIEIFRMLFNILRGLTFEFPFGCNIELPTDQLVECMADRPPNFFQVINTTCLFATNFTVWVDDSIEQIAIEITGDPSQDIIPNFATPIGSLVCAPLHVVENVIDLIFHLDLTGPTTNPPVHYFLRIKSYNVILYLFQFCDELDYAFAQIDDIVANIGCIFTNLVRALTQILDWLLGFLMAVGDDVVNSLGGTEITTYLADYDYNKIVFWLDASAICLETAGSEIYAPLGDLFTALVYVISEFLNIIVQIFANVKKRSEADAFQMRITMLQERLKRGIQKRAPHTVIDPEFDAGGNLTSNNNRKRNLQSVVVNDIAPRWYLLKRYIRAFTIALGNVFRWIEIAPGCTINNPFAITSWPTSVEPPVVGVFCAVGASIETGLWTLSGTFLELPIDGLIAGLSGDSAAQVCTQIPTNNGPLNIYQHFTQRFNSFVLMVSAIIPNLFAYINSPIVSVCIIATSNSGSATLVQLLDDTAQVILFPVQIIVIGVQAILAAIANELGSDFCPLVIVPFYDATLGRITDMFFDFIELIVCIVSEANSGSSNSLSGSAGQDFECFMLFMIGIFGSSDRASQATASGCTQFTGASLVSILCDLFTILLDTFDLIFLLFTDPSKFFQVIWNALSHVFNCIGIVIVDAFVELGSELGQFFTDLGNCIADIFSDTIASCFTSSGCSVPDVCSNLGNEFSSTPWDNIGNGFIDCLDNITININPSRKRGDSTYNNSSNSLPPLLVPVDWNTSTFDLQSEIFIAMNQWCAPLVPFGVGPAFKDIDNLTRNAMFTPQVLQMLSYYDGVNASAANFTTMPPDLFVFTKEFHNCLTSAMSSRMADYFIFFETDPYSPIVPRWWRYDDWAWIKFLYQAVGVVGTVAYYEYQQFVAWSVNSSAFDNSTITFPAWTTWAWQQGYGEDIFRVRGGWWLAKPIDSFFYNKQGNVLSNKLGGGFFSNLLYLLKVGFGNNGIYANIKTGADMFGAIFNSTNNSNKRSSLEEEYEGGSWLSNALNISVRSEVKRNWVSFVENWFRLPNWRNLGFAAKLRNATASVLQDPLKARRLIGPARVMNRVQQRLLWNTMGAPRDWRYGLVPPNTTVITDPIEQAAYFLGYYDMLGEEQQQQAKRAVPSYPVYSSTGNFQNISWCVDNACLHCELLTRIIDVIVDLSYLCVLDTQYQPIQLNGDLRVDSIDQAVVPSIDPSFWDKRDENGTAIGQTVIRKVGGATSEPGAYRYGYRSSLAVTYMNHETEEELEQVRLFNLMDAKIARQAAEAALAKRQYGDAGQPGVRLAGLDKINNFLNTSSAFMATLFRWSISGVNYLTGWDLQNNLNSIGNVLINGNNEPDNGWEFYFNFARLCNFFDNSRCNVGRQGFGFRRAFGYTLLGVLILVTILVALQPIFIFGQISSTIYPYVGTLVVIFGYATFQSLAYFASPMCAAPLPLPIIPECIANDFYVTMRELYAPCVNYTNNGLPGFTDDTSCPPATARCVYLSNFTTSYLATNGSSSCVSGTAYAGPNERVFIDCSVAPYNFNDGLRNIFYILYQQAPSVYSWLNTSSFAPVQWVFSFSYVDTYFTFDFSGSGGVPNDTWNTCNKVSTPNWLPLIVIVTSVLGGIVVGILLLVAAFALLFFIFIAPAILVATLVASATNYKMDISQVK